MFFLFLHLLFFRRFSAVFHPIADVIIVWKSRNVRGLKISLARRSTIARPDRKIVVAVPVQKRFSVRSPAQQYCERGTAFEIRGMSQSQPLRCVTIHYVRPLCSRVAATSTLFYCEFRTFPFGIVIFAITTRRIQFYLSTPPPRSVIRFLQTEGNDAAQIHRRPCAVYGNTIMEVWFGQVIGVENSKDDGHSFLGQCRPSLWNL